VEKLSNVETDTKIIMITGFCEMELPVLNAASGELLHNERKHRRNDKMHEDVQAECYTQNMWRKELM
jgi:hypothetical protein